MLQEKKNCLLWISNAKKSAKSAKHPCPGTISSCHNKKHFSNFPLVGVKLSKEKHKTTDLALQYNREVRKCKNSQRHLQFLQQKFSKSLNTSTVPSNPFTHSMK